MWPNYSTIPLAIVFTSLLVWYKINMFTYVDIKKCAYIGQNCIFQAFRDQICSKLSHKWADSILKLPNKPQRIFFGPIDANITLLLCPATDHLAGKHNK